MLLVFLPSNYQIWSPKATMRSCGEHICDYSAYIWFPRCHSDISVSTAKSRPLASESNFLLYRKNISNSRHSVQIWSVNLMSLFYTKKNLTIWTKKNNESNRNFKRKTWPWNCWDKYLVEKAQLLYMYVFKVLHVVIEPRSTRKPFFKQTYQSKTHQEKIWLHQLIRR